MDNPNVTSTNISIIMGRYSNTANPEDYYIRITDDRSRKEIIEVRLTGEEYAAALTSSHGYGTADVLTGGTDAIGKHSWNAYILMAQDFDAGKWEGNEERLATALEEFKVREKIGAATLGVRRVRDGIGITARGYEDTIVKAAASSESCLRLLKFEIGRMGWTRKGDGSNYPNAQSLAADGIEV